MLAIMVRHSLRQQNVHEPESILWQKTGTQQKAEVYQRQALQLSFTQL